MDDLVVKPLHRYGTFLVLFHCDEDLHRLAADLAVLDIFLRAPARLVHPQVERLAAVRTLN